MPNTLNVTKLKKAVIYTDGKFTNMDGVELEIGSGHWGDTITLEAAKWDENKQTIALDRLGANDTVMVQSYVDSKEHYLECGVLGTAQAAGLLTFSCDKTPTSDLKVNIAVWEA